MRGLKLVGSDGKVGDIDINAAETYAVVTPSNDDDLPGGSCRGLWVGTAGDVYLVAPSDPTNTPIAFLGVPAGYLLPVRARRVGEDTTATNIIALY